MSDYETLTILLSLIQILLVLLLIAGQDHQQGSGR